MLADVLSVLAVTVEDKNRDCLHFRLAGSKERISSFGHPYIRWCALFGIGVLTCTLLTKVKSLIF